MKLVAVTLLAPLMLASCKDMQSPTVADPLFRPARPPAGSILDGAHGGNPHFFFLPPLGPKATFSAVFDGSLDPVVEICAWTGTDCDGPPVAELTTQGRGSQRIRVKRDHYSVKWHTKRSNVVNDQVYRISVLVDGIELGHVDVQMVKKRTGKKKDKGKKLDLDDAITIRIGPPLRIRFRIEEGALALTGNLDVTASTTGPDPDSDGYSVTIDGTTSQPLGVNGTVSFLDLTAGDHTVELTGEATNCTVGGVNPRTVTVPFNATATTSFVVTCTGQLITGITFDFSTYQRTAFGSDNWPLTWCEDDHQYTSWGDGRGFGGNRVSLGFARIEGDYPNFVGVNVFEAPFDGKSASMLCLNGILYAWRSTGSNFASFDWKQIIRSVDKGVTWEENAFPESRLVGDAPGRPGLPYFINYGKNYSANQDGYVYIFSIQIEDPNVWEVQKPGVTWLARALAANEAFADLSNWEWVVGFDASNNPIWGIEANRVSVLDDPDGVMRSSVIYNPGLDRFVMATVHTARNLGNIAIWESPNPWGPWRLVMKEFGWPQGGEAQQTFAFGNFSPKWLSADGRDCVFVWFRPDDWNSAACRFETAP